MEHGENPFLMKRMVEKLIWAVSRNGLPIYLEPEM